MTHSHRSNLVRIGFRIFLEKCHCELGEYEVYTNASLGGFGCVLMQQGRVMHVHHDNSIHMS